MSVKKRASAEDRKTCPPLRFMRWIFGDGPKGGKVREKCGASHDSRGIRWFCVLDKGHYPESDHCRVDMDLRYFNEERATFRTTTTAAIPVRDLDRMSKEAA